MAVQRWTFYDSVVPETYTFLINPNEGGSPTRKKNVKWQVTAGQDGSVLIYEGRQEPKTISFSGVILEQAHLVAFETWFAKARPIVLTDDLSRQFTIYITEFDPKRVRSALHRWKHTFTCSAVVFAIA